MDRWFPASAPERWAGRVAAIFFVGGGSLVLITIPIAPNDGRDDLSAAIAVAACVIGVGAWLTPWERLPRRANLVLVPPAFAMIALGNIVSGRTWHDHGPVIGEWMRMLKRENERGADRLAAA